MQKDIHFYATYALARRIGVGRAEAEQVAWADQYADEMTRPDLHEIQTQSALVGNWADRQVQLSVLIPFHFVPGSDAEHPWMTTANSARARQLVRAAEGNLLQLGIALHALQDTFSHQGFSGWREDLNSCFEWYYVQSALPNVGHAELRVIPDVASYVWTDPRSGRRIDNKRRAMSASRHTCGFLADAFGLSGSPAVWEGLKDDLKTIFRNDSYNRRVDALCVLSGDPAVDYREVKGRLEAQIKEQFVEAASAHLARAMKLFRALPWRP